MAADTPNVRNGSDSAASPSPVVNLNDVRGLLAFVHRVRHEPSSRPESISEVAWYRSALAQVEVQLEGLLAALEEHGW